MADYDLETFRAVLAENVALACQSDLGCDEIADVLLDERDKVIHNE